MSRRAAKVDENQTQIAQAFRKLGASVLFLHGVGMGCPDILVGIRGRNLLVEIKDGNKAPSKRKLTDWQEKWHADWRGQADVVESLDDVERLIGTVGK